MSQASPSIIVCPLAFERDVLRRELAGLGLDVLCSGPGPAAVDRAVQSAGGSVAILAGLAGAAAPDVDAATAWVVSEVRSPCGQSWLPPLQPLDGRSRIVIQAAATIESPAEKRVLGRRHGAHLIDLESAAFAEAATRRGLRWGIVRAVSDDAHTALPAGIDRWIDQRGRVRPARVLGAVLRHPRTLLRLSGTSRRGLVAAGELITSVLGIGEHELR